MTTGLIFSGTYVLRSRGFELRIHLQPTDQDVSRPGIHDGATTPASLTAERQAKVNEKQAKLLRYFTKYTGQAKTAHQLRKIWPHMDHKSKGKVSKWLKRLVVINMHVQKHAKTQRAAQNASVLAGF